MEEKNLQLDRLVFFSDAVVAIAITLLALDLKVGHTHDGHLHFPDIAAEWKTFAAFLLSFFNIANFWTSHHTFFGYIKKIDRRLMWYNINWLLFIVVLPFSTSLVSAYFSDYTSIVVYSLNLFAIAVFQNMIWDYASDSHFTSNGLEVKFDKRIRLMCNLDMLNSLIGIVLAFFHPTLAFIFLLTKLPIFVVVFVIIGRQKIKLRKSGNIKKEE